MLREQGAEMAEERDDAVVQGRLRLRRTFESAASLYDRARPRYPAELFDALVSHTGVRAGDHVLEVGCATGIATQPLAELGLHIVCVELGEDLAHVACEQLTAYPHVEVICGDYESWIPARGFDLVVAAAAWHWLDPSVRYQRAWEALRCGGHLAFWSATHVFPDNAWPTPGRLSDSITEIEGSGLFADAVALQFDWEVVYGQDAYIDLLNTFSGHVATTQEQRDTLYRAIRERIAQRAVPEIARHWAAVLHIARRLDA